MITFSEFQKISLVAGKVLSVDNHPNADNLLVLKVDTGEDRPRTLVAGLRKHYEPARLEGKTVVVVTNLEPVKLRGVESQGMLLAAQDGDTVSVLMPDCPVSPGSRVS